MGYGLEGHLVLVRPFLAASKALADIQSLACRLDESSLVRVTNIESYLSQMPFASPAVRNLVDEKSPVPHAINHLEALFAKPTPSWKRVFDVVGATTGLLFLSPLIAIAALMIRCTSRGPVLFRQRRSGIGGRPFELFKFRTMRQGAEHEQNGLRHLDEQDGPAFKITNDPRVTFVGRILRRTCVDELPQLFNVLKGEMSLIGPRPLPCNETDACVPWQRRRLDVQPGMTCIWQSRGRELTSFDEWMRLDLDYIDRRSPITDLCILLRTIPVVLCLPEFAFKRWRRQPVPVDGD